MSRRWLDDRWRSVCQAQTPVCAGRAVHSHHRKLRSQGGDNSPENLLRTCLACHARIHAQPAEAYERGWLVHGWDDPALISVGAQEVLP